MAHTANSYPRGMGTCLLPWTVYRSIVGLPLPPVVCQCYSFCYQRSNHFTITSPYIENVVYVQKFLLLTFSFRLVLLTRPRHYFPLTSHFSLLKKFTRAAENENCITYNGIFSSRNSSSKCSFDFRCFFFLDSVMFSTCFLFMLR